MIIEKILENCSLLPSKIALIYQEYSLNYEQLMNEIINRSKLIKKDNISSPIFLDAPSEFQNLLNHLAANFVGIPSVFSSKNLTNSDKISLQKTYNLEIFSFENWEFSENIESKITRFKSKETDIFLGVLTSGSTGIPKLIWKDNSCWERAFQYQSSVFKIDENDTVFVLDALGYSANLNAILHALWQGATVFISEISKAKVWGEILIKNEITSIFLVPSHLRLLSIEKYHFSNLKTIVTAGEKLSIDLAKGILKKNPQLCLTEYYGTAELGHISYQQNDGICKNPTSVGCLFPSVKVKIIDQKIHVFSPFVSPEYRGINTVNDLGLFQDEKLILLGRAGRMFNRRGLNVFAEEIESRALEMKGIADAVAIGVKLASESHFIVVFFEKIAEFSSESNASPTDTLRKFLIEKLPTAKRPQKIVELEKIPRFENGKVNFRFLETYIQHPKEEKAKDKFLI